MKNQYFGDRTDYIKHSLLRRLSESRIDLAIHWNRTPDDGTNDGKNTAYLRNPAKWRSYDADVFDLILDRVNAEDRRLNHFEEFGFIKGASFCYDEWLNCPDERRISIQRFIGSLERGSLVFLDPDNGLETKSVAPKGRNSHKYIYLDDLMYTWLEQHSIVLYQHYPRVSRSRYLGHLMTRISENLRPNNDMYAISTSFAAFLFVLQPKHMDSAIDAIISFSSQWSPHVTLYRQNDMRGKPPVEIAIPPRDKQFELPL